MENGKENKTGYRVEQDSIGAKDIPGDVYYGVQSLRAAENFRITGLNMHPEIINSLAYIKKASAITNCESGILDNFLQTFDFPNNESMTTTTCPISVNGVKMGSSLRGPLLGEHTEKIIEEMKLREEAAD